MHPGLLVFPVLGLLLGIASGVLLGRWLTHTLIHEVASQLTLALCIAGWLGYVFGVLYWRFEVEPGLDGTEGAGAGYGAALIYVWGVFTALFLTGLAVGIRWGQRRRQ